MTAGNAPSASAPEAADSAAIAAKVGSSGSSFYTAMRILPAAKRDAMFAIYAFCREVDDIADEPAPEGQKPRELQAWREEIDRLYKREPATKPVGKALAGPIAEFGLQKIDFLAIIDGMAMDAARDIQAPSEAELLVYCDRVASAVGRLSVRVFGRWIPRADDVAEHMGQALQLTNILRDLDEDGARGRLYLPRELLQRHGIEATDPETVLADPRLDAACRELAQEAIRRYREAEKAISDCGFKDMRPAAMMGAVYRLTLNRLLQRGWLAPREPVEVSKLKKLWVALTSGFLFR